MSWGGPVAGAAPYQSQPYPNGQPGYGQQPPFQYGQQQQQHYSQYPPGPAFPANAPPQRPPNHQPPKKKGNPIITRYPPPPGYRGPAQSQPAFSSNQYPNPYQAPQPAYPQVGPQPGYVHQPHQPLYTQAGPQSVFTPAVPVPPVFPNQGYAGPPNAHNYSPQNYGPQQPPSLQPQPFPQAPNYQWPQQAYPPNQGYQQAQTYPATHTHVPPASGYPNYPSQAPPVDPAQQPYGQASNWPAFNGQAPGLASYTPANQYNSYNGPPQAPAHAFDTNATPTPATAQLVASQSLPTAPQQASATEEDKSTDKAQLFLAWDDWDFDFEGAIWPKSNEPVDPNLSLGVIIWHPAEQMTRALSSTFDEAEQEALKPSPEKLGNGESVSMYFTFENSHEAFLDVRQTDDWENVRDDPIFVVFSDADMGRNLVSLEDCIAQRDRSDPILQKVVSDGDEEMPDATWSVMDHLEQVLASVNGAPEAQTIKAEVRSLPEVSQEDILSQLGVTGEAKPPSGEPVPLPLSGLNAHSLISRPHLAAAPPPNMPQSQPPPQRAQSYSGQRGWNPDRYAEVVQRPHGSMSSANSFKPPPPPPLPESHRNNPWNQSAHISNGYNGAIGSPTRSEGSNHTMVGSDFEPDEADTNSKEEHPVIPVLERGDSSKSRKRSYDDADHSDEKPRQQDDYTKRKRRAPVDAAYSRR